MQSHILAHGNGWLGLSSVYSKAFDLWYTTA